MDKYVKHIFLSIKSIIKDYGSRFIFSVGVGGIFALYLIEFCRVRILPNISNIDIMHGSGNHLEVMKIHPMEVFIFLISIISIMISPLLSKKKSKIIRIFSLIVVLFMELVSFMSIIVYQEISSLFIVWTMIMSVYLIWIAIDILKVIYNWLKINKESEEQVDIAKLTFIWAIIAFILGLLK